MKKSITLFLLIILLLLKTQEAQTIEIKKNSLDEIEYVRFHVDDDSLNVPTTSDEFFSDVLKVGKYDTFTKKLLRSHCPNRVNECFQQYYNGIKVEDGKYVLHFKNGKIEFAHGNYVRMNSIKVQPSISSLDAIKVFGEYKGLKDCNASNCQIELIIKQVCGNKGESLLVYKIYSDSDIPQNNEIVYINAHSGKIEMTSPIFNSIGTTATFHKLFGDTIVQSTTDYRNGWYYLEDYTRGNGILTMDKNGGGMSSTNGNSIRNSRNTWCKNDLLTNNQYYALDVHWGMQQLYDYLFNAYNINSLDNAGMAIKALINTGINNSICWNNTKKAIFVSQMYPSITLDVIAHELGHGITGEMIDWDSNDLVQNSMNEGLSDIWGVIMDYTAGTSQAEIWKIGEEQSLVRNIEDPNSIAFRYDPSSYTANADPHYLGGIFTRWFYLLVNGGEREMTPAYDVEAVGFNLAEELVVNAIFEGYLIGVTDFYGLRNALMSSADAMDNAYLWTQTGNAWHAVGIGDRVMSISGSKNVCYSGNYVLENPLNTHSTTIDWSVSNSCLAIQSGQGTANVVISKQSEGVCTLTARILIGNLPHFEVSRTITVGTPDLTSLIFNAADGGEGYWNGGSAGNNIEVIPPVLNSYDQYEYEIYKLDNSWNPTLYHHFYSVNPTYEVSYPIGWYDVRVRGINACGWSDWIEGEVEMTDNWRFGLDYNSASETLLISSYQQIGSLNTLLNMPGNSETNFANLEEIQIWNTTNMVRYLTNIQTPIQISMYGLPNGVYTIRVIKDGKSYSKKFFKS